MLLEITFIDILSTIGLTILIGIIVAFAWAIIGAEKEKAQRRRRLNLEEVFPIITLPNMVFGHCHSCKDSTWFKPVKAQRGPAVNWTCIECGHISMNHHTKIAS